MVIPRFPLSFLGTLSRSQCYDLGRGGRGNEVLPCCACKGTTNGLSLVGPGFEEFPMLHTESCCSLPIAWLQLELFCVMDGAEITDHMGSYPPCSVTVLGALAGPSPPGSVDVQTPEAAWATSLCLTPWLCSAGPGKARNTDLLANTRKGDPEPFYCWPHRKDEQVGHCAI